MQEIVNAILHRRHFWKKVRFDELSELYMSLTLRALGLSLIGIFIPVYLWQQGFELSTIALFFSSVYFIRLLVDPITASMIYKYGPKHILRASYVFEILFLLAIIAVGNTSFPLWAVVPLLAAATSSFFIPFNADFSNVRSAKHVGRQLSSMKILEKVAGAIGPLAGGLVATWAGFEVTVGLAIIITIIAVVPLLFDGESGRRRDFKYKFSVANYTDMFDDAPVFIGRGFDVSIYAVMWPLFAATTIFASEAYAGLGFITAAGLGATLLSAHLIGKLVDNKRGRQLFRAGVAVGTLVHFLRPFIVSIPAAASANIIGDTAGSAMDMPLLKGTYFKANHYKHGRLAYTVSWIGVMNLARGVSYGLLFVWLNFVEAPIALSLMIFTAATLSLLMLSERFKALNN